MQIKIKMSTKHSNVPGCKYDFQSAGIHFPIGRNLRMRNQYESLFRSRPVFIRFLFQDHLK